MNSEDIPFWADIELDDIGSELPAIMLVIVDHLEMCVLTLRKKELHFALEKALMRGPWSRIFLGFVVECWFLVMKNFSLWDCLSRPSLVELLKSQSYKD